MRLETLMDRGGTVLRRAVSPLDAVVDVRLAHKVTAVMNKFTASSLQGTA